MATLTKSTGTVTLKGAVEKVTLPAAYGWVWVKNMSEGDIFAGLSADISDGADGIMSIPAGEAGRIQMDGSYEFYLLGSGNALVVAQNYADCPFKTGTKGGGADVGGESSYTLKNAVDYPLLGLNLYGKSVQDGTPTPENPVEIVSVGDNGNISVQSCGKNLLDMSLVQSTTKNGVTFTVNTDGSVLANGTASAYIAFDLITLTTKGDYIYSGTPKNGSTGTTGMVSVRITKTDNTVEYGADNGAGNKLVMDDSVKLAVIRIELHAGASPDNVIFYPMLRYKTEEDATFEPYQGTTANITSALPLCGIPVESGGNYTDSNGQQWICDEVVYNADGTGKIIKNTAKIVLDGSDDENWKLSATINSDTNKRFTFTAPKVLKPVYNANKYSATSDSICICDKYISVSAYKTWARNIGISIEHFSEGYIIIYDNNCATLTLEDWKTHLAENPVTLTYQLNTPQEIELSAAEMSALRALQTYNGITNISNDGGADMDVSYCTNKTLSEYVMPITTGLQKQIDELKAAVLSLGGNV